MPRKRFLPLFYTLMLALSLAAPSHIGATPPVSKAKTLAVSAENCDYGGEFKSIEAVDAQTVRFTLCYPDPAFLSKIASPALGIQSSKYLEAVGIKEDISLRPVGTGPYQLVRWEKGTEIVFSRNESYWGEKAKAKTLIFRWNSDATQRLTELLAGTVDGIDNVNPGDFKIVENNSSLKLYTRPSINVAYVGMSAAFKPFDDVRVRQAVAYALDRQRIVDNFYPAGSIVATQFLPPSLFGYTPDVKPFPFDPAKAEQLLDEAGLPRKDNGIRFSTTLVYRDVVRAYLPQPGTVAQDIQLQLAKVGIDVKLQLMESGAFLKAVFAGDQLPMHLVGGSVDYPDGSNLMSFIFSSSSTLVFGTKLPEISGPVDQTNRVADPQKRLEFFRQANIAIRDLAPVVPFAHATSAAAYKASVTGAHVSPMVAFDRFAVMQRADSDTLVWMQNAEPVGLYCALNTDGEALRACSQVHEGLMAFAIGGSDIVPGLAEHYDVNSDSTVWTFRLRPGVVFHDGSALDANDVVLTYIVQWDAKHPLHPADVPNFQAFFGNLLHESK